MSFNALFLLIPVVLLIAVGVWGWRNAEDWAKAYPVDEKTQRRRRGTYKRGSVTCFVAAAAFIALIVLSFTS